MRFLKSRIDATIFMNYHESNFSLVLFYKKSALLAGVTALFFLARRESSRCCVMHLLRCMLLRGVRPEGKNEAELMNGDSAWVEDKV
jgi:hypothetical protein